MYVGYFFDLGFYVWQLGVVWFVQDFVDFFYGGDEELFVYVEVDFVLVLYCFLLGWQVGGQVLVVLIDVDEELEGGLNV